jgi:O-antigen/teichoic acid export membrane protein
VKAQESIDQPTQFGETQPLAPEDRKSTILVRAIPWIMKGAMAVLDQGLIAGSNFVIGILLARWLAPQQYGTYAVAFAVFLLFGMLYQSLLIEPVGVFGVSAYGDRVRGYVKSLVQLHMFTALPTLLLLGIAGTIALWLKQADGLAGALFALALSTPFVLLFWLVRRAFYLQHWPVPAVWGAALYCLLALGGLYAAYRWHVLSSAVAFLLMGIGAISATAFLLHHLRGHLPKGGTAPKVHEVWQRHWNYGKWALGSAAMMWVPANIFYPLVSSFKGMAQAGELKALMNFATPMLQFYGAIALLLLPHAARVHARKDRAATQRAARRMTILCLSGSVLYWAVLLVFRGPVFRILYSGRYTDVQYLMPVVALASLSWSAFFGPATMLRAMEAPDQVFGAVALASCISVLIGIPATKLLGVQGAAWAMAISETLAFLGVTVLLIRKLRNIQHFAPVIAVPVTESGAD